MVDLNDKDLRDGVSRERFDKLDSGVETSDIEDEDEMRVQLLTEMEDVGIDAEAMEQAMIDELAIFKDGSKYSFVHDLREGFDDGLRVSAADKIFDTLPDHVFYDIKKPAVQYAEIHRNKYNPARKDPN